MLGLPLRQWVSGGEGCQPSETQQLRADTQGVGVATLKAGHCHPQLLSGWSYASRCRKQRVQRGTNLRPSRLRKPAAR